MSEQRAELVSALIDGELDGAQREQALDALLADPALRQRWNAYHLIGDALRAQRAETGDVAARVRAALDEEPALPRVLPAAAATPSAGAWLRPLGGLALAASLATVAVLGGHSFEPRPVSNTVAQGPAQTTEPSAATALALSAPPDTEPVRTLQFVAAGTTRMQWTTEQPAVQQRLNAYLVDYSEYLGADLRGMLPYARVVGYDGRRP